ncbi:MAG: hypothetical protein IH944_14025 [Armatimonadetes bacterium]|nr:hypothetical protein [Armatimonadota bacterium]
MAQHVVRVEADDVWEVSPEVIINIEHDSSMRDILQIYVVKPGYTPELLRSKIQWIASELGSPVDGLEVYPMGNGQPGVKAICTVNNVVDPTLGELRIQPLIRAFLTGSQGQTIKSFSIRFSGFVPTNSTLQSYRSDAVVLEASFDPRSSILEYRVLVRTDDPAELTIPPRYFPNSYVVPSGKSRSRLPIVISLLVIAGLSAGALVYFAQLRGQAAA